MLFEAQKDRVSMRELRDAMAGLLGTHHEAVAHLEHLAENRRNPASQLVDQVISIAGAP